ncbi:helix-turn-helix domain-containing protein, partial [Escherichia coli]
SVPFSAALRQGLETCQILLLLYDWPGNIRELRNMMERLALFLSVEPTPDLTPQFLQLLLPELARKSAKTPIPGLLTAQQALEKFNGDKTAAANYLGISRTTFWRRLKS